MPVLTIVAGANGSGKTTLTTSVREEFQASPLLDPDAIAKTVTSITNSGNYDIRAAKEVLRRAQDFVRSGQSFTVETTLSGNTYIRLAKVAKMSGFRIVLVFVGTASLEMNMLRIRGRVDKGGHNVPEEDQRRRWPRTRANLLKLMPLCNSIVILDNTSSSGFELVLTSDEGRMIWADSAPKWARYILEAFPVTGRA